MASWGLTIHSMPGRPNAVYGLVMMMMIYLSVDCMIVTILPALQLVAAGGLASHPLNPRPPQFLPK